MKCSNCGAENVNDARFCFNCGSSIMNDTQPVPTMDDTQDIPEIQQQYDYEQPQYGYEQPQYVPEQPQYVYEQNQYSYEKPAQPKKSSKAGVVIAVLVTVLLLLIAGIVLCFGYNEGWFDSKAETQVTEEQKGPQIISISKDKLYKPGNVELWLTKCTRYEGSVKPSNADKDYIGPLEDISGSKYFVVSIRVRNVKKTDIDFSNTYLSGSLDDKYNLEDRLEIYYESDDGTEFDNNSIIEPGEAKTVYFVCSVPDSYADSYSKLALTFGFDSKFSSKPYTKGKDACDYLFEVVAVK